MSSHVYLQASQYIQTYSRFSVAYMIFIITSYAFTGVSSNHVGKFTGVARQVMDIGYSMSDLYERVLSNFHITMTVDSN